MSAWGGRIENRESSLCPLAGCVFWLQGRRFLGKLCSQCQSQVLDVCVSPELLSPALPPLLSQMDPPSRERDGRGQLALPRRVPEWEPRASQTTAVISQVRPSQAQWVTFLSSQRCLLEEGEAEGLIPSGTCGQQQCQPQAVLDQPAQHPG